ncbi:MAG: CNNM domain-containing protein, partial [Aggregatilineales bacterium]
MQKSKRYLIYLSLFIILIISAAPVLAVGGPTGEAGEGSWGGLIFFISIALGISFLCSVLEAVLLSTSVSFVQLASESGKAAGRLMQKHKANVERPISAILTLNTIAHTVGAAGAGAEAVGIFGDEFFGVISAVLTLLILVFSEIIPKTIGATYWKQLNGFAAYTIQFLVIALFPAVWMLERATSVLGSGESIEPTVSRHELEAMARISQTEGALKEGEGRILTNLLHLRNVHVEDVMTPRTVVVAFQQDMSVKDAVEKHPTLPYSRIPLYDENTDDIHGFVLRHDIFHAFADGEP